MKVLAKKLFDNFIINQRYYAIQTNGAYYAKDQFINQKTIERILENKESFLCYQEDFNLIKWICFDFDINKEIIENGQFQENEQILYSELIEAIKRLTKFLDLKDIDYLLEFSGNRGIHLWILFESPITRQDGYIIFQTILDQADIGLNTKIFSLDKYPKSLYSKTNTDKGTGVKIPLSFHQKSQKYSFLFNDINDFSINKSGVLKLDTDFIAMQLQIIEDYKKQKKKDLFDKLSICQEDIEKEKNNFLHTKVITFDDKDLNTIITSLNQCQHLNVLFSKAKPNEKERRIVVGLLGQLKDKNEYIGKKLLYSYFLTREGAIESIIKQRLLHAHKFCPPTCDFFRNEYNINCTCSNIVQTPLEFLEGFSYLPEEIFGFDEELFYSIRDSQKKYTKQNDEIALYHTLNNLSRFEYTQIKSHIETFLHGDYKFDHTYTFIRQEQKKHRTLHAISAKDKLVTTYAIKLLDSIFYKHFSSRSFGYKFNPSFRQHDIFENWLKQWKIYVKELKTIIYADDYQDYYVLKLDLKSYYDSINLEKLHIELNNEILHNYHQQIINEHEKKVFLQVTGNLLKLSKQINNNSDQGLPQGPAYARYLAEFHLSSLDNIIEKQIEAIGHYYRYVDDIFIIMPTKKDIDTIENSLIQHIDTKYLVINENKLYKGTINNFKEFFTDYIDNTKYFIDHVSKHQNLFSKTTIHSASSKLLKLIKDKDNSVNDKNLTFLFTHLHDSNLVINKREELEEYIINQPIGRGSFFNIFWRYYFNKYSINTIDFSKFINLEGLKRECFLHSLTLAIRHLKNIQNDSLKKLLDGFLSTNISSLDKLMILEIYMINQSLFNETIINLIGDETSIYNDLILSSFPKELHPSILETIATNITELDQRTKFDYLYNIMLFAEHDDLNLLKRFSKIFLDTINTIVNSEPKITIEYLTQEPHLFKYIQILYLSTLFYDIEEGDFENIIYPAWRNLLYNVKETIKSGKLDISKLYYWKEKIKACPLKNSNVNILMTLLRDKNNKLSGPFGDDFNVIDNFFDSLIELIYLENVGGIAALEDLQEIKKFLIEEKKVIYLEWLDGEESVYFPTKDICIKNSIHNDITILRHKNRILVRLNNDFTFQNNIDYLTEEVNEQEVIFAGKYKTIIYSFQYEDFEQPFTQTYHDLFDFIKKIIETHEKLSSFTQKYFHENKFINYFYQNFHQHIKTGSPLIPYDGFLKYFVKDNFHNEKNETNYFNNLIEQIDNSNLCFFRNDTSGIFSNFKDHFFPMYGFNDYHKRMTYLIDVAKKIQIKKPNTIFDLEEYLIDTILSILEKESKNNFFTFFQIYLSFNRQQDKKYVLFHVDDNSIIETSNLALYFQTIKQALEKNGNVSALFEELQSKLVKKVQKLEEFIEVTRLKYEVGDEDIEVTINDDTIKYQQIQYLLLNDEQLNFINATEQNLDEFKEAKLFYWNSGNEYKLILIPDILESIHSKINQRKRLYQSQKEKCLFKPLISLDELKLDDNFSNAVNVLNNHYRYSNEKFKDTESIEFHLFNWLRCFGNEKEIKALLYVIAHHQYISATDAQKFIALIKSYKITDDYFITTLKNTKDHNGTHRLITLQTDDADLWQQINLDEFPTKVMTTDKNKIIFLADNSISGGQIKKAFQKYYLNDIYDPNQLKDGYFPINETRFNEFKTKIRSLQQIVFLCVVYTNKAKQAIQEYFTSIGFHGEILFEGNEKDYEQCIFEGLTERENKEIFTQIILNKDFMEANFEIHEKDKNFLEYGFDPTKIQNRNLLARVNSMPKMRFHIFTHQPKYYEYSLFYFIR